MLLKNLTTFPKDLTINRTHRRNPSQLSLTPHPFQINGQSFLALPDPNATHKVVFVLTIVDGILKIKDIFDKNISIRSTGFVFLTNLFKLGFPIIDSIGSSFYSIRINLVATSPNGSIDRTRTCFHLRSSVVLGKAIGIDEPFLPGFDFFFCFHMYSAAVICQKYGNFDTWTIICQISRDGTSAKGSTVPKKLMRAWRSMARSMAGGVPVRRESRQTISTLPIMFWPTKVPS